MLILVCFLRCVSISCYWSVRYFFFFKQKTAYEMRISDWSSDVCSSDLLARRASEQGVRLTPPDASFVGGECAGGVRLSIMATTNRDDLERSLRVVAALRDEPDEMVV